MENKGKLTHDFCLIHAAADDPQPNLGPFLNLLRFVIRGVAGIADCIVFVLFRDQLDRRQEGSGER